MKSLNKIAKKSVLNTDQLHKIEEILDLIRKNASSEFEVIWKENKRKRIPRSILSDRISEKINRIKDSVYRSDLFEDETLFQKIIECCCPPVMIKQVEFENILQRVPSPYLKAIFASRLVSRYVYEYGFDANEIDFFNFLREYK